MAEEVAQEKDLNLSIRVYKDPENSLRYKADITVNGWATGFGGWFDRKYIIDDLNADLQKAWVYLGFLEQARTEENRESDLLLLRTFLEDALAHTLAYEIAQDNVVTEEEICNRWWNGVGAYECAITECAGFVKEDLDACMESCRKALCETTPKEEGQASEKYPRR